MKWHSLELISLGKLLFETPLRLWHWDLSAQSLDFRASKYSIVCLFLGKRHHTSMFFRDRTSINLAWQASSKRASPVQVYDCTKRNAWTYLQNFLYKQVQPSHGKIKSFTLIPSLFRTGIREKWVLGFFQEKCHSRIRGTLKCKPVRFTTVAHEQHMICTHLYAWKS